MPPQLIRVLRLSILSLQQRQRQRQRLNHKQHYIQPDTNSRGLNLAFPACPFCSRKVTCQNVRANSNDSVVTNALTAMAENATDSWLCQACNVVISENDINWTFRLAFFSTSAINPSKEISASVLGHTADIFYGCTASQWVEAVDHTNAAFRNNRQLSLIPENISISYLEEQLSTLVDLISGLFDEFILADLKRSSQILVRGKTPQYNALHMSIPTTYSSTNQPSVRPTLLWLWHQLASAALSVAERFTDDIDQTNHTSQLCIADIFTTTDCIATKVCSRQSKEYGDDLSYEMTMHVWNSVLFPIKNVSKILLEPRGIDNTSVLTGTSVSEQDFDSLFENYSQLLLDSTSPLQPTDSLDLSTQLLCESLHDEYLHNLFTNSQSQYDKSMSQNSEFTNDDALIDVELENCPSFSSFLAATPLGFTSESTSVTPSMSTFRDYALSIETASRRASQYAHDLGQQLQFRSTSLSVPRSTPHTPLRGKSGSIDEPIVLAQDTPVSMHSPHPSKRQRIYVAETPVSSRSLSFSGIISLSQQPGGSVTPFRISGENTPLVIPETPAVGGITANALLPTNKDLHQVQPLTRHEDLNDPPDLSILLKRRSSALFERRLSRLVTGEGNGRGYAPPPRPPKLEPLQNPRSQKSLTLSTSAEPSKRGRAKPLTLVKNSKNAGSGSGKPTGHRKE